MGRTRAVSDEEIVAAIIGNNTITAAAEVCGISSRTINDRMKEPAFRQLYREARADILRGAVLKLNQQLTAAIDTVSEIMADKGTNSATRLQAAQTIISNAARLSDKLTEDENAARKTNQDFVSMLLDSFEE